MNPREKIVRDYSRWTVLSALRAGPNHPKSRDVVYPALDAVRFCDLLDLSNGPITEDEFGRWHQEMVQLLCDVHCNDERALNVGWASKMLNIYLKTTVYLGGLGRPRLIDWIHPPIDRGLWRGLRCQFANRNDILGFINAAGGIGEINHYPTYMTIVKGCRLAAQASNCKLIEVEQYWTAAESK